MALTPTTTSLEAAAAHLVQLCNQTGAVLCLPYNTEDRGLGNWFLFGEQPVAEATEHPQHLLELSELPDGRFGAQIHLRMHDTTIVRPLVNATGRPVSVDELNKEMLLMASLSYRGFGTVRLTP